MSPRHSDETAVQNGNSNHDNAEKGKKSKDQDQKPEEVGLLHKHLRPILFDVVKNIALTSTIPILYLPTLAY